MSAILRGGLFGACLVAACVAGYLFRSPPSLFPNDSTEPAQQAAKHVAPVAARTTERTGPSQIQLVSNSKEEYTPKIDFDKLAPPPQDPKADPDPNDLAFQIVKKQLGIKTTILGELEPVPAVLADARKGDVPLPGMDPMPLMGPTPRLSEVTPTPPIVGFPDLPPPPVIDVPEIRRARPLVKERDIALDFEITRMGFSKIVAVELWTTRDEGKTWQKTDRKEGCESPFRTRLWSEGDYGFKLVFESETGMKSSEPKPGQSADFGLILDATPPKVSRTRVYKSDLQPRSVTIAWDSEDERPDHSFIRIEYSVDGTNWNEIPDVKPRSQKTVFDFNWTMPDDIPPRLQLRITTRDQAGNYGMGQTSVGAVVDLLEPAGKITGIREENSKPEVGPRPREVEKTLLEFQLPIDLGDHFPKRPSANSEVGPMPREVEGLSWIPRVLEFHLPSKASDALLSSLVLLGGQPTGWDISGNEIIFEWETYGASSGSAGYRLGDKRCPPFLVKEWLADLTNTVVGEDTTYQIPPFRRRNSCDQPIADTWPVDAGEEACEMFCGAIWAENEGYIDPRTGASIRMRGSILVGHKGPVNRNAARKRLQLEAELIHDLLSRGQTIMKLVNDRGWKPSTAAIDSDRFWGRGSRADRMQSRN